jgi:hypothetical protein
VIDSEDEPVDLRRLLAAVEEAPPIEVVDVLAAQLGEMVEATHVSLLIANFSGNAVVRLSHIGGWRVHRIGHNERVESLSLTDSSWHDHHDQPVPPNGKGLHEGAQDQRYLNWRAGMLN